MLENGSVIGLPVTVGTVSTVAETICNFARTGREGYVCVPAVHQIVLARKNPALRSILEGALIVAADGMPLVWELRRQGFSQARRVSGPDLMPTVCRHAQTENISVYFYGGDEETVEKLQEEIHERYPDLNVTGYESPPLLHEEPMVNSRTVERINRANPDIVFVGLGCPKQEYWMEKYQNHLSALLIGVGAAFDFMAGTKKRAPAWMRRHGLEWLFRLCQEPRRLWQRYLKTNTLFLLYWIRAVIRGRPERK